MGIEAVLALLGGIALLVGIFGGGIEAEKIKIPQIGWLLRIVLVLTGTGLLVLAIYLSSPGLIQAVAPAPATATPVPTGTPLPTSTSTSLPTDTPAPTSAPSVTPIPTLPILVLSDSFDSNVNGWFTGAWENDYLSSDRSIVDGKYRWDLTAKRGFIWYGYPDTPGLADFSVSVDGQCVEGPAQKEYGLVFRVRDGNYYVFRIDDVNQKYQLYLFYEKDWTTLIDWTLSYAIRPEEVNHITVVGKGSQFTFYINGTYIDQASDATLANGKVGVLMGLSNSGDKAVIEFDNFELRSPGQ
jgi:hypothetical protein